MSTCEGVTVTVPDDPAVLARSAELISAVLDGLPADGSADDQHVRSGLAAVLDLLMSAV